MIRNKRLRDASNDSYNIEKLQGGEGEGEEELGVKSRYKRVKKYVFDMFNTSRPRPPFAPTPSKSRKIKDQQEGGGFIYSNNSNKSNIKPNLNIINPREDIIIDRGGVGICGLITRLPKTITTSIQQQQQQQQSSSINNNKSNFFSNPTSSSRSKSSNYSSLSKPMEIIRPPPLQPYTPSTPLVRNNSNGSTPSAGELARDQVMKEWKWNVLMAKSEGVEPPKKPELTYVKKRPMGSSSVSQKNKERTDRELQKRSEELRLKAEADQSDSFAIYRKRVDESNRAEEIRNSLDTSDRLPGNILRKKSIHKSSKDSEPFALDRTLKIAKDTAATPKPVRPILENYDELMRVAEELAQSLDVQLVKKRKYPKALSPEDQERVSNILREKGVVSTTAGAEVLDKDIRKLSGLQWLNDEVITFYAIMINSRSNRIEKEGNERERKEYRKCYSFTSFFYAKLSSDGHKGVARWSKKVDLFSVDKVIIPINQGNSHWVCAAIDIKKKRFEFYDSLGRESTSVFKRLREYLKTEHLIKKKSELDLSEWTDHWDLGAIPQQSNGCDCGVFTCQFMESLSRKMDTFDFAQSNMPYLRNRMILDIKDQKIREEDWA